MPEVVTASGRLRYEESGRGDGPPLVLVHGLGSSVDDWEPQFAQLARHRRLLALDLPGHGKSPPLAGRPTIGALAGALEAFLRALSLDRCDLAGISLGGMISVELALRHPRLVRRLVLINTPIDATFREPRARLEYVVRLLVPVVFGMRVTSMLLARRLFPLAGQGELRREFVRRWKRNRRWRWLDSLRALAGWTAEERLAQVACPTLVLVGDRDYFPVERHRAWAQRIPNGRLEVVAGGHHAVTVELPAPVNRAIDGFLSAVGRRDGSSALSGGAA